MSRSFQETPKTTRRAAVHAVAAIAEGGFQNRYGWQLPRVYSDVATEYRAATEGAAVHDASYVGRLMATGDDTLDLLNRLSTNEVLNLQPGQGAPTVLTTDRGRILDLIGTINIGDYTLLLTSPEGQQRVIDWLDRYTIMEDLVVEDLTADTTMLSVLGPLCLGPLEGACAKRLGQLPAYHAVMTSIDGQEARVIHRPSGELPAYDLVISTDSSEQVWQRLVESGLTPVGMEAYQAVRVEQGVPNYGQEMGELYNPLEAGLIGSIDFAKGCYIGQEVVARLETYQKVHKSIFFGPKSLKILRKKRYLKSLTANSPETTDIFAYLAWVEMDAIRLDLFETAG